MVDQEKGALVISAIAGPATVFLGYRLSSFWDICLSAALFYLSLGLGGMFFVLLQFVCRAGWSVVPRRTAENLMGTLPFSSSFLLLVLLGSLLPARANHSPGALGLVELYWSPLAILLRSFIYLMSWSSLAWWFRHQSIQQDQELQDDRRTRRLQSFSAPALVWMGLTVTLASFDWISRLQEHWYSSIFGVYFFSGCMVGALGLLALLVGRLQSLGLLPEQGEIKRSHDLGKLLFGFVVFWAYIGFSQYLLIWYADIPEETAWYTTRLQSPWSGLTAALAIGHFVLPFLILLPARLKTGIALQGTGLWLVIMHYLDIVWITVPSLEHPESGWQVGVTSLLAIGGLFVTLLGWLSRRQSLVPLGDPRLEESLGGSYSIRKAT